MYKIKVFLATGAALATTVFSSFANLADDLIPTLTQWKATAAGIDQLDSYHKEEFDYTTPQLMAEEIARLATQGVEWSNVYAPNAEEFIKLSHALRISEISAESGDEFFSEGTVDFGEFLNLQSPNVRPAFGSTLFNEKIEALNHTRTPEISFLELNTESHSTTGNLYFDVNALSQATSPIEAVIIFRAGSWLAGTGEIIHPPQVVLIDELTKAGKIVLHAHYRSLPLSDYNAPDAITMSDIMDDVYCATKWLHNYINTQTLTLGGKTLTFKKKITALGFSAGSQLALSSAQFKDEFNENMVDKVFVSTPVTDLKQLFKAGVSNHPIENKDQWLNVFDNEYNLALIPSNPRADLLTWNRNTRPFEAYSPRLQIAEVDPATQILFFNCADDPAATLLQSFEYYDAAKARGIDIDIIYTATGEHAAYNQDDVILSPQVRDFLQF